MKQKSKIPQIGEAIFCIVYLIFGYVAGAIMLLQSSNNALRFLFGITTLVLAFGDSFHLVPRIINAFKDKFESYDFFAGLGLMISSITMTIFYILFYYTCRFMIASDRNSGFYSGMFYVILLLSAIRIVCCVLPQNNWFHKEGNAKLGIIRNVPFVFIGMIAVYGCIICNQIGMAIAIIISFACYLPVVFWAKKKPMIGMLMIPKTIAYMWIICIALRI